MKQTAIPFMQLRGGSSKGVYFLASDLPSTELSRNQVLLDVIGRDTRQIDGLGGGDPLTSKVAIVSQSKLVDADIDFLFVQIVVGENRVDTTPNCGNLLAGVGAFAIEAQLITATHPQTRVAVNMLNTNKRCELILDTPDGEINYEGNQKIDGVSGSSAPIICNYLDVAGSVCGSLFPTGNLKDQVEGITVTCVDNGMPVVVIRAEDLGISGYERPKDLNTNEALKEKLERIRLAISPKMNISNAKNKAVPKMCIISPAKQGGIINTRTFIPHHCHAAIGVLGAVSIATACISKGSVAQTYVTQNVSSNQPISVEHPSGEFAVNLDFNDYGDKLEVKGAGVIRTARLLSKGTLFVPNNSNQ
ncbi:4-oxalomesaconate tautomerase [Paraglaciecola arctica]|uniref:4-oxalomesaconate tautomerase n=1 Tax=Paraglaciecola arctica TaxID=1128911 RepID=UPI00339D5FF0